MDKSSCDATDEWWTKETVGVVTGANRGIGLEIARLLADKGITVVLTARCRQQQDLSPQSRALMEEGRKNVVFHTLDIQRDDSVTEFAQWLKNEFGGLDILINNAAVGGTNFDWDLLEKSQMSQMDYRKIIVDGLWAEGITEDGQTAKEGLGTNYFGTKRITKALIPLLKPSTAGPRIVNVSSILGLLRFLRSETMQKQLSDIENISEEFIDYIVKQYMEDIERGADLRDSVWPVRVPTYSLSKVILNAYTRLLARELKRKACVNSVHPGYVRTSMTFNTGDISSVQGAENVINNAAVGGTNFDWDLLEKSQMDFRKIIVDGLWAEGITEDGQTAKEGLDTNYFGTRRITKALIPLLKPSAAGPRIVNVSPVLGLLRFLRGETLQKQLSDIENISEEFIDCIVKQYMEDIERGADLRDSVWPVRVPTYSLSKVILNAYTRLLARELKGKACVNSVHPGYVRTSMTFNTGDISPVQGAENVVRVALLPPGGPTGQNFLETQIAHF